MTTREKSYTKIAGFSTIESISLVLDILYSCYFASNFDNHFAYKTKVAESTEKERKQILLLMKYQIRKIFYNLKDFYKEL